ncbi:MAG: VOC family protein [Rhizobiaceae bacterium]|nr:VOC family protein [Rhizobiaceae bacterium]
MTVRRVVANIAAGRPQEGKRFYCDILGMAPVMDQGWIVTFASPEMATAQVSVLSEGGSGTAVPDLSIEVDNLEEVLAAMRQAGIAIEYGPADEPWGVRRFYVRDPFGRLVNVLSHR